MGTFLAAERQYEAQDLREKHRKQPMSLKIYEINCKVHRNL